MVSCIAAMIVAIGCATDSPGAGGGGTGGDGETDTVGSTTGDGACPTSGAGGDASGGGAEVCDLVPSLGAAALDYGACRDVSTDRVIAMCGATGLHRPCDAAFSAWCTDVGGLLSAAEERDVWTGAARIPCGTGPDAMACNDAWQEACTSADGVFACSGTNCATGTCVLPDYPPKEAIVEVVEAEIEPDPDGNGFTVRGFDAWGQEVAQWNLVTTVSAAGQPATMESTLEIQRPDGTMATVHLVANDVDGPLMETTSLTYPELQIALAELWRGHGIRLSKIPENMADECDDASDHAIATCTAALAACSLDKINPVIKKGGCVSTTAACIAAVATEACVCGLVDCN